ncbi:MAG TPA: UDP-glucose/GDP-mannose dehydrogenase family protein [Candidatus Acidoferrales bacterium]|nr:UDP-glucose/GDP-mannose dehydrogenase family protein [Candidatus Acidoferrales bacterium]
MKLAVIGCGYVGLVSGSCLAEAGHEVIATDNDGARIAALQAGKIPIYEPNLDKVLEGAVRDGRLRFTADAGEAVRESDVIFICVGTPPTETGEADLSAIDNVARMIAKESRTPKLVIEKSTVPAQTGEQLKKALQVYATNSGAKFRVASNPEFLREGTAVEDFFHPDRIVIGVEEKESEQQLRELYRPILEGRFRCPVHQPNCPPVATPDFVVTTIASAELIKHASNSFLGLKISYANVLADLCERLGGNVEEVTRAVGLDPRIGGQFLKAGLGFGGFCLPKDIQAFIKLADRAGVDFGLLKEAELVNKQRVDRLLEKVKKALWVMKGKQIGVLGIAFKPNTDDIRLAPAIEVIRRLLAEGSQVRATDPEAMERARAVFPNICYSADPYEIVRGADALLVLTEWEQYRRLDWKRVRKEMARPLVIDGRNMLRPAEMRKLGFEYMSFGRPDTVAVSAGQ